MSDAPDLHPDGVDADAVLGTPPDGPPPTLGADPRVRAGTILYSDVVAGDRLRTGHGALVREATRIGDDVTVGTQAVVDGHTELGDGVSLQTGAYVPAHSTLGDRVFLGPNATLTNDPYPLREAVDLAGPRLGDDVSVGAGATVVPDVDVGARSFVAAGAVVVDDVPPESLVTGVPGRIEPLPEHLDGGNGPA